MGAVTSSRVTLLDTSWTGWLGGTRAQTHSAYCWPLQASLVSTPLLQPPDPHAGSLCPPRRSGIRKSWCRGCGEGGGLSRVCVGWAEGNLSTVHCGNPAQPSQASVGLRGDPLLEGPLLPTRHSLNCPWRTRCQAAPNLQTRTLAFRGSAPHLSAPQPRTGAEVREGCCGQMCPRVQTPTLSLGWGQHVLFIFTLF